MGKLFRYSLFTALVLVLQSCGFALRGSDAVAANFSALALDFQQPQSEFSRLLQRSLDAANVETTTLATADRTGATVLAVSNEQVVSRPVTINPRARASQVEIRLSVEVTLSRAETELIPTETLMVNRTYFQDIENIAGNQEEVQIITSELRRELVNQLMRRLESAPNEA